MVGSELITIVGYGLCVFIVILPMQLIVSYFTNKKELDCQRNKTEAEIALWHKHASMKRWSVRGVLIGIKTKNNASNSK